MEGGAHNRHTDQWLLIPLLKQATLYHTNSTYFIHITSSSMHNINSVKLTFVYGSYAIWVPTVTHKLSESNSKLKISSEKYIAM